MKFLLILICAAALSTAQYPDTFLGEVPIGSGPADICISPDGTRAYAAVSWGFAAVVEINGYNDFTLTDLVDIDGEPAGVQCDGTGDYLYVSDSENCLVHIVNTSTLSVESSFEVQPAPADMVLCSGIDRIFLAHTSGMITVINTDTRAVEDIFWAGEQLYSLAVSPDETVIYAADNGSPFESVISTGSYGVSRITSGMDTRCCTLSGNGEKLYLSCTAWGLVGIMDTESLSLDTVITCTEAAPSEMICLPDLPYLYGINTSTDQLDVYNTEGFIHAGSVAVTGEPVSMAVHPDGERIFLVSDDSRMKAFGFDPAGIQPDLSQGILRCIETPSPSPEVQVTALPGTDVSLLCHDLSGRLLFSREIRLDNRESEIVCLRNMPSGFLLVTAESETARETVRVLVLQP